MRTYRNAVRIILCVIVFACIVTVGYSIYSAITHRNVYVNYGPPISSAQSQSPVNINTASAEELQKIPGIGAKKAADIVAYRESNGAFSHIEDIMNVPGIGQKTLESIADYICV